MDWVTGLPPGGDRSCNACLVTVDIFSKTPIVLPYHKDDTIMDTALLIWNRVISWTIIFTNIISERYPKFTSALWTKAHQLFGTDLSFSTAYHPQADGLAERMIQTLEDMVRRFCAYGLEFKDCDGFTHDWCTLLPALELAYKTSINASTNQTPAILEKGWNHKLPQNSLRKYLVEIRSTAGNFKGLLEQDRKHEIRTMEDSLAYARTNGTNHMLVKIPKWNMYYLYPPLASITSRDVKISKTPLQNLFLLKPSMGKIYLK
ncbi:hypothetical protein O181_091499 [Austropuccinia psidii MF-1]|uniref:Integrase catalytic domain-containing protein n=1 Tax=Austropuccinia psidii MF-1 TaxID=1389203 RepID=A0A9Q3IXP7_9BASI|nr:hypothetical protein [Austropuccinia psidii MF-1]